jgi:hypothetical protein
MTIDMGESSPLPPTFLDIEMNDMTSPESKNISSESKYRPPFKKWQKLNSPPKQNSDQGCAHSNHNKVDNGRSDSQPHKRQANMDTPLLSDLGNGTRAHSFSTFFCMGTNSGAYEDHVQDNHQDR